VTTRADERRRQRRRQHVETTRRGDAAIVDHSEAPDPGLLESRWATVRLAVTIACLLGAQFLHWSVIDQHAKEWAASGDFFFILALVEGLLTVLVIAALGPWVAKVGIAISTLPVVVWAWDRSIGLPFGPNKGVRGTIGRSDVLSVVFELITIFALWPFLRPGYGARRPVRLDVINKAVIGITIAYVVGFSYWAMIGDEGAVHKTATGSTVAATGSTIAPLITVATPTTSATPLVPVQTLAYLGKEYSFSGPSTVAAGVTRFNLQNAGVESHQLEVARIPDETPTPSTQENLESLFSEAQFHTALAPTVLGASALADAGATATIVVDLTPGRYILACGNSASDGVVHYAKGMITVLTVTDPAASP
jgi:hypothetical protein